MSDTDRIAQLERDVAFLARYELLNNQGHAKAKDHGRAMEIAERPNPHLEPDGSTSWDEAP